MEHGDGEPLLLEYQDYDAHLCYVVMKSDIADSGSFRGTIEAGRCFDFETPYGYGGPLYDEEIPEQSQILFFKELYEYCKETHVVSQFVRFHPLLDNHKCLPGVFEKRYMRDTVYMDTASPELIMANMDSKNRNMVRKAIKNGVTIERRPIEDYEDFLPLYHETMIKNQADEYYLFDRRYFEMQKKLTDYACIFYALYKGRIIAGAIMYYNDRFMHYHLAGTCSEYRQYSPGNLLLYEAACWAGEKGIKRFHLGGGMSPDDSLFGFKKQFNKHGRLPFWIGRTIFDTPAYDMLLDLRIQKDPAFDRNNTRMIQYRF